MTGITITLMKKTPSGTDGFGRTMYDTETVSVDDVLVGEPTTDEITNDLAMYG